MGGGNNKVVIHNKQCTRIGIIEIRVKPHHNSPKFNIYGIIRRCVNKSIKITNGPGMEKESSTERTNIERKICSISIKLTCFILLIAKLIKV